MLLSVHEYELMDQKSRGFWNALVRQVMQDRSVQITDSDFKGLRDSSAGRIESFLNDVVRQNMLILPYDDRAAEWHAGKRVRLSSKGKTPR